MNSCKIILLSLGVLFYNSCSLQLAQDKNISIAVPTIEQEATFIWRTINDIEFLEGQGYKINLPENDSIQSLIEKSRNGEFGNDDFSGIYNLLETSIYTKSNYELALRKVRAQEELINQLVDQLYTSKENWDWGFKTFENYNIIFTLYGTGGSYDPDLGTVTLFTTLEGDFMSYDEPANTIMHEIVHMGIEESIVQKYEVPHGLKERIVDKITYIMFSEFLPEYKVQNMGDTEIDDFLRLREDINELDSIVEKYKERE